MISFQKSTSLRTVSKLAIVIGASLVAAQIYSVQLWAGDLEWSGLYRAEGYTIHNSMLDSGKSNRKEYGVHTLILNPKIVAADGLYINSQLNIFNSEDTEAGNQSGAYFGHGIGTSSCSPDSASCSSTNSNTAGENQASEEIRVTQFYLTFRQEYGALIVGRVPLDFGLGISHSAGKGFFDHYSDTRDMVGYKMVMGNFFVYPMYTKLKEGGLSSYDDASEFNVQLQYENPENDSAIGLFYQNRSAGSGGNDTPAVTVGGSGASIASQYNAKNFNIFYKKESQNYNVGFEVAQQSGSTGVHNSAGKDVSLGGFAFALEYEWHPIEKKTAFGIKLGSATGDDPNTPDQFEGFIFDRNYEVAMLMFNFGFGQADLLHTRYIGRDDVGSNTVYNKPDTEAISNVTYFSPYFKRKFSDKWSMVGTFTTAMLDNTTIDIAPAAPGLTFANANNNLGYELDLSMLFNVSEKAVWINQIGYLEPGKAWEVSGNYNASSVFGFVTKAAVSF